MVFRLFRPKPPREDGEGEKPSASSTQLLTIREKLQAQTNLLEKKIAEYAQKYEEKLLKVKAHLSKGEKEPAFTTFKFAKMFNMKQQLYEQQLIKLENTKIQLERAYQAPLLPLQAHEALKSQDHKKGNNFNYEDDEHETEKNCNVSYYPFDNDHGQQELQEEFVQLQNEVINN